jgi:hypothetical protein
LQFEVSTSDGTILNSGAMHDPAATRLEFEVAGEPGKIGIREVKRESTEFVLRLPYTPAGKVLRFYSRKEGAPGKLAGQAERQLVGTVALPDFQNK